MKKVISRKIVISWKFLIFRNSQFSAKLPEIGDTSTKIPGNLCQQIVQKCRNIRVSRNSRDKIQTFPRKVSTPISNFHENRGSTFSRIPGNFGRQNSKKCKNIRVSRNSRDKIQIFPGKFLSKFLVFTKIRGRRFPEFPGILVDKKSKNARIYGFPRILDPKPRFFPGNFHENSKFSRHFGVTRHEIPGNFGRKNPVKCRNIRVLRILGGKNYYFPGNFGRPVARSRKNVVVPQACTFKNIRVSRSPQAHILAPRKDPQKFICT